MSKNKNSSHEWLVGFHQATGECNSSSHNLFKFPLKPIQIWGGSCVTPPHSQTEVGMREMMWVRLEKQRLQPGVLQSKHENTHMRNTQRKLSLDIRQLRNKSKAKTFHTHELDANEINHKALISISVSKDNCAFPIGWRLGDEGFLSKWYNIKSSLSFFFLLSDTTIHRPLTHAGPSTALTQPTHTHTPSSSSPLPVLRTSHPLLGMITLRNHPALAPTPRAQVRERTGH